MADTTPTVTMSSVTLTSGEVQMCYTGKPAIEIKYAGTGHIVIAKDDIANFCNAVTALKAQLDELLK